MSWMEDPQQEKAWKQAEHGLSKRVHKFRKSSIISDKSSLPHLAVQSSVAPTILLLLPYKVGRIPFMSWMEDSKQEKA